MSGTDTARRRVILANALRRAVQVHVLAASLAGGLIAGAIVGIGAWWGPPALAASVLVALAAAPVTEYFLGRALTRTPTSDTLAAFAFVGEWALERWSARRLGRVPLSPAGARRWLARRWPAEPVLAEHVGVLAMAGRIADARAAADALPTGTAWERFERELERAWVAWIDTGQAATAAARAARDALVDDADRRRADAMLALAAARERLDRGEEWRIARLPPAARREGVAVFWRGIVRRQMVVWVGYVLLIAFAAIPLARVRGG